ncbi:MAG: Cro/CI family transcriptional regulator [Gammaproteobacteria bacterium]
MSAVVEKVIEGSGGVGALAKALGVTPQAIHKWRKDGLPRDVDRILELERISGVPREELCPELTVAPSTVASRKRA